MSSPHVLFPFFPLFTARKIPILNVLLDAYISQHKFALAQDLVYFLNHPALNRNECSLGPHHAGSAFPYHQEVPLNFELLQRSVSLHTDTVRMLLITDTTSTARANDLPMTFPSTLCHEYLGGEDG